MPQGTSTRKKELASWRIASNSEVMLLELCIQSIKRWLATNCIRAVLSGILFPAFVPGLYRTVF